MDKYERIIKECFWDYKISKEFLENISNIDDFNIKKFVFEKILLNSSRLFEDLTIFSKDELRKLVENYKVSRFNSEYSFRRKNVVEFYFFNKPLLIDELKWIVK